MTTPSLTTFATPRATPGPFVTRGGAVPLGAARREN